MADIQGRPRTTIEDRSWPHATIYWIFGMKNWIFGFIISYLKENILFQLFICIHSEIKIIWIILLITAETWFCYGLTSTQTIGRNDCKSGFSKSNLLFIFIHPENIPNIFLRKAETAWFAMETIVKKYLDNLILHIKLWENNLCYLYASSKNFLTNRKIKIFTLEKTHFFITFTSFHSDNRKKWFHIWIQHFTIVGKHPV